MGADCDGHECDSDPCLNNGTCVNITSGSGYKCDCTSGFEVYIIIRNKESVIILHVSIM